MLETLEILSRPEATPDATVIWMHGLGADNRDFVPIVPELDLGNTCAVRFVFPNAGSLPVTINGGYIMQAWYDILERQIDAREDEAGLRASERQLAALIHQEHGRGIAYHRIVLAGFSQGSAMALQTGLRFPHRLGGIVALSGYLPLRKQLVQERHTENLQTPIFMAHGTQDPVVPFERGQASARLLAEAGHGVDFRSYPMQHSLCEAEVEDIGEFLRARLQSE